MGVKYGICEKIFAIEKIPMQVQSIYIVDQVG